MHKKTEILKQIKAYTRSIEPQSEVVLFGSRARHEANEESDWDILILTPYPVDLKTEQKFRHKLYAMHPVELAEKDCVSFVPEILPENHFGENESPYLCCR